MSPCVRNRSIFSSQALQLSQSYCYLNKEAFTEFIYCLGSFNFVVMCPTSIYLFVYNQLDSILQLDNANYTIDNNDDYNNYNNNNKRIEEREKEYLLSVVLMLENNERCWDLYGQHGC